MRRVAQSAPKRTCKRGCAKPRQPSSSPKDPKTTGPRKKHNPPGPKEEREGKRNQCRGGAPPRASSTRPASENKIAGPMSASAYQVIPTRQIRIWRNKGRTPPPPENNPATIRAVSVGT